MDFVLQSSGVHDEHDKDWVIYSPHYDKPVCIGCILEIMENNNLLPLVKKPALTEMLRLLTHQGTEIIQMFIHQEAVVWLLQNVLMENLCVQEESCITLSIDTLVKLVQQVGSQDLLAAILDSLAQQVDRIHESSKLLPQYTLIGKMLHQLPGLATTLLTEHGDLLHQLSLDLSSSGEAIQSAIAYNFIYLCDTSCVPLWSPRLLQQVHTGILKLLSSAVTVSVQINGLGLLKRLIACNMKLDVLMALTAEGTSVLSTVKKLLLTKKDVLQIGVCQVLYSLLTKHEATLYGPQILNSDIAEFLFEALHTQNTEQMEIVLKVLQHLSSLDLFYKRCHAVYGLESVLHGLSTAQEMKHPDLLKLGLALLGQMLKNQPTGIPLFMSSVLVQKCLQLIHTGHTHHLPTVQTMAQLALTGILRKEHLLLPIPFSELLDQISMVTDRVWSTIQEERGSESLDSDEFKPQSCTQGSGLDQLLSHYMVLLIQACSLGKQCEGKQTVCESTFTAPGTDNDCSLTQYSRGLLQLCDEAAIPLIMMYWDRLTSVSTRKHCIQLLCQLDDLDPILTSDLLYKMVDVGFVSCVLEAKVTYSDPQMTSSCVHFLYIALESCQPHGLIPREVSVEVLIPEHTLRWSFRQLSAMFADTVPDVDVIHTYLLLLYISYRNHNNVLPEECLERVLTVIIQCISGLQELSHLGKKHLLFLLAYATVNERMDLEKSSQAGVQYVIDVLRGQRCDWYTHDEIFLHFCTLQPTLMSTVGYNVLEAYLDANSEADLQQILIDGEEGCVSGSPGPYWADDQSHVILGFCQHASVRQRMLLTLATAPADLVTKLELLLKVYLEAGTKQKETSSGEINTEASGISSDMDRHRETLQEVTDALLNVFLKNIQPSQDHNISALLRLFVSCRKESTECPIDIKLFCHVTHQLTKKETDNALRLACLNVIHSIVTHCGTSEHQVCALVVQNEQLVTVLQECVSGHRATMFYTRGCDIITTLLLQTSLKPGCQTISLNITKLLASLWHGHRLEQVSYLILLAALFQCGLETSLVQLEGPLTETIYRKMFICLQQLTLSSAAQVSEKAVRCIQLMLKHLMKQNNALGLEMLQQPWNTILVDTVLDQMLTGQVSGHMVSLLQMFSETPEGWTMLRSISDIDTRLTRVLNEVEKTDGDQELAEKLRTFKSLVTSWDNSEHTTVI